MITAGLALAACGEMSPERAADRCEERARLAQGPEVGLRMGVSNNEGIFGGGNITISADSLQGKDPLAVYESCVLNLTGEPPIRAVRLRDLG